MYNNGMCAIKECFSLVAKNDFCGLHWQRIDRYHSPYRTKLVRHVGTVEQRFWAKVDASGGPDACWPWTAYKTKLGYGRFQWSNDRTSLAHRLAYEELNGPVANDLVLDHLCRNPSCCNPSHLEPVSHLENLRRGNHRPKKTVCPRGHPKKAGAGTGRLYCPTCNTAKNERIRNRDPSAHRARHAQWARERIKNETPEHRERRLQAMRDYKQRKRSKS